MLNIKFDSLTLNKLDFDFKSNSKTLHNDILASLEDYTKEIRFLVLDEYIKFYDDVTNKNGNASHSQQKFIIKYNELDVKIKKAMEQVDILYSSRKGFFDYFTEI